MSRIITLPDGRKVRFDRTPTKEDIQYVMRASPDGAGTQTTEPYSRQEENPTYAGPLQRAILSFGDEEGQERYMQEKGIDVANRPGFDFGDVTSLAGGAPALVLGTGGDLLGKYLGAHGGAALGSPLGPGGTATGFLGGGYAGGVAGGSAGETLGEFNRQLIGKALGVHGETDTENLKGAAKVGAASSALAPLTGRLLRAATLGRSSAGLYKKAFYPGIKPLEKFSTKGIDLPKEWANLGLRPGGIKSVLKQVEKIASESSKQADEILKASNKVADWSREVVPAILETARKSSQLAAEAGNSEKAKKILSTARTIIAANQKYVDQGKMSIYQVNRLKKKLQNEIGERFYSEDLGVGARKTAEKALRGIVEKYEPSVADINKKTSVTNELIKVLNKMEAKSGKPFLDTLGGGPLMTLGGGLGGYALGSLFGNPLAGALGVPLGMIGIRSAVKGTTSVPVRMTKAMLTGALEKVPPEARGQLMRLLLRQSIGGGQGEQP